jgi:mannose-6-phosphate isomerase-like protein (cupin superfamily)
MGEGARVARLLPCAFRERRLAASGRSILVRAMKTTLADLLSKIPGGPSEQWPEGERYALGISHGSMTLGLYAPINRDPQKPHKRDELYIIQSGTGELIISGQSHSFMPGDAFFVGAGVEHRFEDFSEDFNAWVVFWGAHGGEQEI